MKPGHPIHLTLSGVARFATKDAEVLLTLPEVTAAEQSGWDDIVIPMNEQLRPHVRLRRSFNAGEAFREMTSLTIPEPGLYAVVATAKQHSEDWETDRPYMVGDTWSQDLWLWIDEKGGRVLDAFDPTLFPEATRRTRGPLTSDKKPPRVRPKGARITCSVYEYPTLMTLCPGENIDSLVFGGGNTGGGTNAQQSFTVTYRDLSNGVVERPLPGARAEWKIYSNTGSVVASGSATTTSTGATPVISCQGTTAERAIEVFVFTENADVNVYRANNQAGGLRQPCGGSSTVGADDYMAHLFINMNKTREGHRSAFNAVAPRVRVGLYASGGTHYSPSLPEVQIQQDRDHVFGAFGIFAAAHEFGHLWQDKHLYTAGVSNGLIRYYSNCARHHFLDTQSANMGCSFGEGFADWYAVMVRGTDIPSWTSRFESNYDYLNCQAGYRAPPGVNVTCTNDGSLVEGAIAAFLYDIVDPAFGESHDQMQEPAWRITDLIRTCKVGSNYTAYTGVDHIIYCMEQRRPYQVTVGGTPMTFFNTRAPSSWPSQVSAGAIAPYSDILRRLWLVNLYSLRSGVGLYPSFTAAPAPGTEPVEPTDPTCTTSPSQFICSAV